MAPACYNFTVCIKQLPIFLCILVLSVTDNFSEMRIRHMEGNVLGLSCRFTNTENSMLVTVSIFEDTPNNTLVTVSKKDNPKVEVSSRAKDIYLQNSDPNKEIHSLDIWLLNYNPGDSRGFGCNYTYIVEGCIQHSLSFFHTSDNTSAGEVIQTNFTIALQRNHEPKEGTSSVTSSTDGKLDSSGHTHLLVALITTLILLVVISPIIFIVIRRRSSSGMITIAESGAVELIDSKTILEVESDNCDQDDKRQAKRGTSG